ncbi:MAG TPA: IS701 family transposase [Streptosporangiaceae bacterium]|nr:IS701 family transposase [Streptosporangiaceae bacterium]
MRHNQDAAAAAATVADDARSALLADLLGRVAGCFPRRETRQSCGQMLSGLLMELDDHNCWTIAEAAGHRGPHRLQHLLSRAVWDDQQVLDIAAAWAAGHLDDGDAVLIVDETADEKSSADAVGAARQYSGTVGGIALCQVAVTLTYASGRGHALVGRALYLPEGRAADEEHRELAGALLDRAQSLGIRAAFVAGDEVYGGRELRRGIRQRGMSYCMAVRANHTLTTGSGRAVTAAAAARMIPARAWHRMRTGTATKGTRHYDWAMLEVASDDTPGGQPDGHSVLLARRHRYTGQLSYYRCWSPGPVPLSKLIAIASARWRIEEDHQLSKQSTGLDAGQVIRWKSWHRWTAICLLAYIYLAVAVAVQRQHEAGADLDAGLIPVTVPELLRLLRDTVVPPPRRDRAHKLHWSYWRRRHQHRARQAHQRWNAYAETTP